MKTALTQISLYPIKSTQAIDLSAASVTPFGLENDRRFVVCDRAGKFFTARTKPELLHIESNILEDGIEITAPDKKPLILNFTRFNKHYKPVTVWGDTIQGQHCSDAADQWFSEFLGQDCQLLFFGAKSSRPLKHFPQHQTAFADGYPLLLISEASLDDLNRRCNSPVYMDQLRPNLVVSGTVAYAEDSWKRIRIGSVEFEITKPCGRCILTTVNTQSLIRNPDKEPLSVLKRYRKGSDGEAHFGQNMIALNTGDIRTGDTVEVLEYQTPEVYIESDS